MQNKNQTLRLSILLIILGLLIVFALNMGKTQPTIKSSKITSNFWKDIDRDANKLVGKRIKYETMADKANKIRSLIVKGDFSVADKALNVYYKQSSARGWHFYPYNTIIAYVLDASNKKLLSQIFLWAKQPNQSETPHILLTNYYYNKGWESRGNRFASQVSEENMNAFEDNIQLSLQEIGKAIQINNNNPYSHYLLLADLNAFGNSKAMKIAFQKSIKLFPEYYPLYKRLLQSLQPKWGGSIEEMYEFLHKYVVKAGDTSPLKMLYINFYTDLLDAAAIYCKNSDLDTATRCVNQHMTQWDTEDLDAELNATLQTYKQQDKYTFMQEVYGNVRRMIRLAGTGRYAGAVLQLTASATGSDIQLSSLDNSRNNYLVDKLAGLVWYKKRYYDNAEKLYKHAIKDIQYSTFPGKEQHDVALAGMYDSLAEVYDKTHKFRNIVVYQTAASELVGEYRSGVSSLKCYALYRMKRYNDALDECTSQITLGNDMQAYYFRGMTYQDTRKIKEALHDFQIVASSNSSYRTTAAINMSVIYGDKQDYKSMMNLFDTYQYLFDESVNSNKSLAVAYNNRCYALMKLGKLKAALGDCTKSLQYDSLPDAYQKQQRLIKMLRNKISS